MHIVFQKGINNFEFKHKTCLFKVRDAVPPLVVGFETLVRKALILVN